MHRPKKYNFTEALIRLRRYCAYQERSHLEVRRKLWEWGFDNEDIDKASVQLMEEGFLNEERFAKAMAGGKFRTKGWGRRKILESLKQKGVSSAYLQKTALQEIEPAEYRKKLTELLHKKNAGLKGEQPLARRMKLTRFALGRGYETDLVREVVEEILNGKP